MRVQAFVTGLAEVYASLQPPSFSPTFLSDLADVRGSLPESRSKDFDFLSEQFNRWHLWAQQRMALHLKSLPLDDPLLCPISLFRTMDYGRLETAHTRTLAWLLDPTKEHGFGPALLAALLRWLTRRDQFDSLSTEHVASEYHISGAEENGRLDVVAEGTWREDGKQVRWILVIEAKVYAWEGDSQLAKYDEWLNLECKGYRVLRVFLTPDGRAATGGDDEWEALSYLNLVRTFRPTYTALRGAPGFHFLQLYLAGVLQDICGWPSKVTADTRDPYSVLDYLRKDPSTHSEEISHELSR